MARDKNPLRHWDLKISLVILRMEVLFFIKEELIEEAMSKILEELEISLMGFYF